MEWYGYIIIVIAVVTFFIVQAVIAKNNQYKNLTLRIKRYWGNEQDREYTHNEYERISKFFRECHGNHYIDDITWNDLGMDDIFMDINNTMSSVGEENLYRMLREISYDNNELLKRDKIIDYLIEHEDKAFDIEKIYARIGRTKSISLYDFIHRIGELEKKSNLFHYACIAFLIVSIGIFAYNPPIGIGFMILSISINAVSYYRMKADVENYFVCFKYLLAIMDGARGVTKLGIPAISEHNEKINSLYKKLKPKFRGVDMSASNAVGGSISEILMDYVKIITHLDLVMFNNMVENLKKCTDDIDELYRLLGEVEAFYAIASYRLLLRHTTGYYCKPVYDDKMSIHGESMYHPLISNPVVNNISADRGVLLTGSNASGKSTFLKTVAINALLAQTIYTCAAENFSLAHTDIYSSMALRDSLENNESYYIVEIKSLKRILDKSNENRNVLCFVDEVLRGTNTVERISASTEILKSMNKPNVICFAATHDIELTYLLEKVYDNYHFREEVTDNDVKFDYKLFSGRAESRNAIKLLGIIGYDKAIIESAEKTAMDYLSTGKWN